MDAQDHDDGIKYTVFIRVPFPRGDFVEPPLIQWNAAKDRELWDSLSSTPKGRDIDWAALAETFDVTPAFLVQQAAWLYEKQLSQVREQLRRVSKPSSGTPPSPTPPSASGSTITSSHAMRRGGSGGSRVPSALSVRPRRSEDFRHDGSGPTTPVQTRVPFSRTTSTNTVQGVQRTMIPVQGSLASSPRQQRRSLDREARGSEAAPLKEESPDSPKASLGSSSGSSSSSAAPISQSRAFPRRPLSAAKSKGKAAAKPLSSAEEEDDEEESPAFLPFSAGDKGQSPHVGGSTGPHSAQSAAPTQERSEKQAQGSQRRPAPLPPHSPSSSASVSSAAPPSSGPSVASPPARPASHHATRSNVSAAAALSPHLRRAAAAGGSDTGTPSMGSSFSDLDDASVTQSALEEALAREIRAGKGSLGVVSRMGGLWRGGSTAPAGGQGQSSRADGAGGS